jgi:hypothetical protein
MEYNKIIEVSTMVRMVEYGFKQRNDLSTCATTWYRQLQQDKRANPHLVSFFIDDNIQELHHIKSLLRSQNLATLHDQIFHGIFDWNRNGRRGCQITRVFEQFIKGITYFSEQETGQEEVPIYHRLFSCGPGDDPFRQTYLQCTSGMDKNRWSDVKKRIERCYIERLIYDQIFKDQTLHFPAVGTEDPSQNDAHIARIRLTRDDFKSCFPRTEIRVELSYDNHSIYPIELAIIRSTTKKGAKEIKEVYKKRIDKTVPNFHKYENVVECFKYVGNKIDLLKAQAFRGETRWRKVV